MWTVELSEGDPRGVDVQTLRGVKSRVALDSIDIFTPLCAQGTAGGLRYGVDGIGNTSALGCQRRDAGAWHCHPGP